MPNPRRISHGRGTSWETTFRVDGRMVRQRFTSKTLALNALARARTQALDGLGITPGREQDHLGRLRAALARRSAVPAQPLGHV